MQAKTHHLMAAEGPGRPTTRRRGVILAPDRARWIQRHSLMLRSCYSSAHQPINLMVGFNS